MLNLVIVDDEKIVRDTILKIIDWNKYGILIAGTYENGLDAYNAIKKNIPDIIVTDIKMPRFSGLELIGQAKNISNEIEIIILSGYGEFEIAQKAMRYGVESYLLKPFSEKQLLDAVLDVKKKIRQRVQSLSPRSTNNSYEKKQYSGCIAAAILYSQENLSASYISLKWLAERYLYMNPDYLGRQFKKETGEKYSSFLNRIRIEKAKELILRCDIDRIYLVAEQVGLGNNPQYFSQLFKKYANCTPSEYRERYE